MAVERLDVGERCIVLRVPAGTANRMAILEAAHSLIAEAWVLLEPEPKGGGTRVHIEQKAVPDMRSQREAQHLDSLAGRFATALRWSTWNQAILGRQGPTVERLVHDGILGNP